MPNNPSLGGAYVPTSDYNRNGATDTGGTYAGATLTSPTVSGTSTFGAGATLTTPKIQAITDTAGTTRILLNPTAKTIVDGSATALFSIAVAAATMVGGVGHFLVRASDGTDHQADAGIFTFSAEAKATVVVGAITYVAANEAKSVSSGTLTLAFTADVSVANVVTYKVQPTGSLTETTYTIEYSLFPIRGVVTIL